MNHGITFKEPIWICRICHFRSVKQIAPEVCPECGTKFSFSLIKPIAHIMDEYKKEIVDPKYQRNPYGRQLGEKEYDELLKRANRWNKI